MRIYRSIEEFSANNPILTIGMFDGVHSGHRAILAQMERTQQKSGGETVLLTFWPHPRMFFGKTENFSLLTLLDEKMELLEQTGLDVCLILPFTQNIAQLTPEEYITNILHLGIGVHKVVIGYDHTYGRKGSGSYELMQQYGIRLGFSVEQVEAFSIESNAVSSTKIRNYIAEGNIEAANQYLSYNYFINGIVVGGHQVGRTLGFPTANVKLNSPYKEIPAHGVYACRAFVGEGSYKAVVNIGTNPTVNQLNECTIEAFLLDFHGDLYGKPIRICFEARLRDEQRFSTMQELQAAITRDVERVRLS